MAIASPFRKTFQYTRDPRKSKPQLYVVLVFEFLSRPEHGAAMRLLAYVAFVYQRLIDNEVVGPEDELPPVIPIVLYNGDPAPRADIAEARVLTAGQHRRLT